jgi:hypothetical protein
VSASCWPTEDSPLALAQDIAGILAAQNLDETEIYLQTAAQIVLMLMVAGWKFTRDPATSSRK